MAKTISHKKGFNFSEIQRDRVEDATKLLNVGDEVEAKFIGVDKKNKSISLSIKAKDYDDEASVMKEYSEAESNFFKIFI
jgi:small subunit ribosomal protein S1